jgi:hypothetical protein
MFGRNLSMVVVATLLLTFISTGIATPAHGKTKRVAVITELKGSATVKSAGGSREYDAYPDMGLNQGDYITTESNSSVKVVIKDRQDEFTIGSNAVVSISTLADKGKDKKSKLKLLSGSVWSNVNKLSGGDDYEVETPTAVMAVRGTKVLTNVNSETGETYVAVAAGMVAASTNSAANSNSTDSNNNNNNSSSSKKKEVLIAPSQQLSLDSRSEVDNLENKVAIIDPQQLIQGTPLEIIQAIVRDKKSIDEENAAFIADQKEKIGKGENTNISRGEANSSLTTNDLAALDKVAQNLNNLIGNVVNQAIEDKKVDRDAINKIIDEVNQTITDPNQKLDLSKVIPVDKTAGVDAELGKAKDEELKRLAELKKRADEARRAADEQAKLKLAEALKKLEEAKTRILKEKEDLGLIKPTPPPIGTSKTPPPIVNGGSSGPDISRPTKPTPIPDVTASLSVNDKMNNNTKFDLNLKIQNVTVSDQVYGLEVHVVWDQRMDLKQTIASTPLPSPTSDFFDSVDSVIRYTDIFAGTSQKEIIYAAVLPKGGVDVKGNKNLLQIPLYFEQTYLESNQILVYVKVVSKNGFPLIDKMTLEQALTIEFDAAH